LLGALSASRRGAASKRHPKRFHHDNLIRSLGSAVFYLPGLSYANLTRVHPENTIRHNPGLSILPLLDRIRGPNGCSKTTGSAFATEPIEKSTETKTRSHRSVITNGSNENRQHTEANDHHSFDIHPTQGYTPGTLRAKRFVQSDKGHAISNPGSFGRESERSA